jgi:type II secretory pathway pseudopilin PulG
VGRRVPARDEHGMTIIEVQVAIIIIGLVMTALCSALMVIIQSSSSEQKRTALEVELRRYSELVSEAPYAPCADPPNNGRYMPAAVNYSLPAGISVPSGSVTAKLWEAPQNRPGGGQVPVNNIADVDLSPTSTQLKTPAQFQTDEPSQCAGGGAWLGNGSGVDDGMQYVSLSLKDNTTNVVLTTNVLKRKDGS